MCSIQNNLGFRLGTVKMNFKCYLVLLVCFLITNPVEAGWFRRTIRNISRTVKDVGCKAVYGVACPLAVDGTAAVVEAETEGTATGAVLAGRVAGKTACSVKSSSCKREVGTILLAFSDNFTDFDTNGDNLISYEEFVFSVMESVKMANAEDLQEPFLAADSNGDDRLDIGEFQAAPFLFASKGAKRTTSEPTSMSAQTATPLLTNRASDQN